MATSSSTTPSANTADPGLPPAMPRRAMNGDDDTGYRLELYVYDLGRGLTKSLSEESSHDPLEGFWHTGVVAYGREYYFGPGGIESCRPGGTILGEPDKVEDLGESQVPYQLFLEYIFGLGEQAYRPGVYEVVKHNSNKFSDEVSGFLCGHGIPKDILALPQQLEDTEICNSVSSILKELDLKDSNSRSVNFSNFNNNLTNYIPTESRRNHDNSPELDELNQAIEEIRHNSALLEDRRNSINEKLLKKEKKKKKDKKDKKEKKEKKEKKKRSKSTDGRKSHINLDCVEDFNSPCHSGSGSRNHSRHNSEGDSQPQIISEPLNTLNPILPVENSSSGEFLSTEPEPFERLPSSREPTPTQHFTSTQRHTSGVPQNTQHTMGDSVPEEAPMAAPTRESPPAEALPEVEREPPITYKDDLDVRAEFEGLTSSLGSSLSPEENQHIDELRQYVLEDEGSWSLGENFNVLFGRVFHDENIPEAARYHLVRIMAVAALKDDVILLLHQDRKDHTIMNYANKVERLPPNQQEALALFFVNMFEHLSPSEWLLYISEWNEGGNQISNIRVSTKVAVNALLNTNLKVQDLGTALMYNLATKEVKTVVFDDVAPELAMAILQYFNSHPPEELLWRTMTALCRFCYASSEVPALIKMIGPEPSVFKGLSERIDNVIEEIDVKLSRVRLF
ncbi:unnamed protein product [Meganyctiphanes norvegica]|uniref:PPPDE domain-containing protein n=1 Tax=Meganyctiphanes norvegica TaxID=48144 RepID=A0AAV2R808_MEGNR